MTNKNYKRQEKIILQAMQSFLLGCTGTLILLAITQRPPEDNYIVPLIGILSAVLSVVTTSHD